MTIPIHGWKLDDPMDGLEWYTPFSNLSQHVEPPPQFAPSQIYEDDEIFIHARIEAWSELILGNIDLHHWFCCMILSVTPITGNTYRKFLGRDIFNRFCRYTCSSNHDAPGVIGYYDLDRGEELIRFTQSQRLSFKLYTSMSEVFYSQWYMELKSGMRTMRYPRDSISEFMMYLRGRRGRSAF